jgi:hypothetical protein
VTPSRRQVDAAAKAAQRRRRKAGLEEVRALVNMPKFISWLVWDGWIREEDVRKPGAITRALEEFLREQYEHNTTDDLAPLYAHGSFGAEYVALRDRPKETVGLLEREGAHDWSDPPARYLITKRNAALRKAVPPDTSPCEPADAPPGAPMFYDDAFRFPDCDGPEPSEEYLREWRSWHGYDEETDIEEASADQSDDALADCFDVEGYETE